MKKFIFLFSTIFLLWGCEKSEEISNSRKDDVLTENVSDTNLPDILYASVVEEKASSAVEGEDASAVDGQNPQTRTYVGGENRDEVLWQNGDAISFFAGNIHNARYDYTGEGGTSQVEFDKDDKKPGSTGSLILTSQAVYPYNENVTVVYEDGIDKINLTYPTTQKYAPNSFGKDANIMVAAGKSNVDDKLYFRNACGYLVIKLYGAGTTVKSVTLSSVGGTDKIVGNAVVVASNNAAPVITMADDASTAVTLDCGEGVALGADAEHATEFWFCLPPVTFTDGLRITVTDTNDEAYTKQTNKTVNITRNDVQPMAALMFNTNAPSATKLWYTRSDESTDIVEFYNDDEPNFNASIKSHKWDGSKFVIEFYEPLDTIKAYAFRDTEIATITLPEGVTTIEKEAFRDTPLKEITIPGTVNNIGIDVFWECTALEKVTFLPSATKTPLKIGKLDGASYNYGPFYDTSLTSIDLNRELILMDVLMDEDEDDKEFTQNSWWHGMFATEKAEDGDIESVSVKLGSQVETISDYMFNYLPIESLTIPGTVKTIGNDVFSGCTKLATLTFEPSPTGEPLTIGYDTIDEDENLFQDNNKLTTLNLNRELIYTFGDSSIDTSSEGLFGGMPTLTNVTLGDQVKTLHKYMFAGSSITSLNLNKVETIQDYALSGAGITELVIPGSVNTIGNNVFNGCSSLVTLTFEPSLAATPLTIGYENDGESENLFQQWCPLTTLNLNRELIYTFEEEAETIDSDSEGLFGEIPTLANVTLGKQVKTLQKYMFAGSGITALEIPATVTSIAQNVFDGCSALSSITFKESAIPLQIKGQSGGEGPFYDSPLAKIDFNRPIDYKTLNGDEFNPYDEYGGLFAISSTAKGMVPAEAETNLTIGQNITNIANYMFCNLPVKTLTIPEAVTTIGKGAFKGSGITNISIPANVESIGNNAFKNCRQLVEVVFEDSATPITMGYQPGASDGWGYGPFYQSPLENIELMREVKLTIGYDYVFEKQNDADAGLFAYENRENSSATVTLQIGDNVKTIHPYMFSELPITEVTIPASVTEIKNDAFYGCTQLTNITFAGGTEPLTIGYDTKDDDEGLFATSQNLATVNLDRELNYTFPLDDLDDATEGIFGNHPSLTSVTLGENVKTVSQFMFAGTGITALVIPGTVNEIENFAFYDCTALEDLRFEDSKSKTFLTLGFQDWSDELGPFYQSPLKYIKLDRDITYNANYAASCDGWDEGAFSNQYYNSGDWTARVIVGGNVTTLPRYMFATMRMQQLHIPESVENIGKGLVEDCEVLNAIVLYDTVKRPENVEGGAFGEGEDNDDIPGNYQYYIFVPYYTELGANGIYHWVYDDTYWKYLYRIMVDEDDDSEQHKMNGHESRYYDTSKEGEAGIIPGYEWYYQRYYLRQNITPPTE